MTLDNFNASMSTSLGELFPIIDWFTREPPEVKGEIVSNERCRKGCPWWLYIWSHLGFTCAFLPSTPSHCDTQARLMWAASRLERTGVAFLGLLRVQSASSTSLGELGWPGVSFMVYPVRHIPIRH